MDFFKIVDNFAKTAHIRSIPIIKTTLDFVPKITIAIPTYKRPELLKLALDSAINQTNYSDFEVVIVDNDPERDCETERLLKTYSDKRLRYYKNAENIGMFGNWNRCIELSWGEYLTILNDDDLLSNDYLSTVTRLVEQKNNVNALIVGFQAIDSDGKMIWNTPNRTSKITKLIPLDLLFGNINPGSLGILFSKNSMIKIGGYNDSFYPSSDYMFLVLYLVNFKNVFYLNKVLTNYRIADNESKNISTIYGFIAIDKKIRNTFITVYPKLKKLIELSFPILEVNQYKSINDTSHEFETVNANQLVELSNKIKLNNKIAYNLLILFRKLLRFQKKNVSFNAF